MPKRAGACERGQISTSWLSGGTVVHLAADNQSWDPFPSVRHREDNEHRHAAHRAIAVSALRLAVTGCIEIIIAIISGSVGLLGDALHNLSDVSTSAVVFVGFRSEPAGSGDFSPGASECPVSQTP